MTVGCVWLSPAVGRGSAVLGRNFFGRFARFAVRWCMKRDRRQPPLLLSKQEAATTLGMSLRHFERHVQAQLPCVRSGQLVLYRPRDLERWADDEATLGGRAA